jgi:hypothetical protein
MRVSEDCLLLPNSTEVISLPGFRVVLDRVFLIFIDDYMTLDRLN